MANKGKFDETADSSWRVASVTKGGVRRWAAAEAGYKRYLADRFDPLLQDCSLLDQLLLVDLAPVHCLRESDALEPKVTEQGGHVLLQTCKDPARGQEQHLSVLPLPHVHYHHRHHPHVELLSVHTRCTQTLQRQRSQRRLLGCEGGKEGVHQQDVQRCVAKGERPPAVQQCRDGGPWCKRCLVLVKFAGRGNLLPCEDEILRTETSQTGRRILDLPVRRLHSKQELVRRPRVKVLHHSTVKPSSYRRDRSCRRGNNSPVQTEPHTPLLLPADQGRETLNNQSASSRSELLQPQGQPTCVGACTRVL
eukprot:747543-Hanusia_phi.AAC.5